MTTVDYAAKIMDLAVERVRLRDLRTQMRRSGQLTPERETNLDELDADLEARWERTIVDELARREVDELEGLFDL